MTIVASKGGNSSVPALMRKSPIHFVNFVKVEMVLEIQCDCNLNYADFEYNYFQMNLVKLKIVGGHQLVTSGDSVI